MGMIVRYSNEINSLKTGALTEVELDLFITAIYLLKDKKTDTITLPFAEFRNLAEIKGNHSDRLIKNIESMSTKLINMNQKVTLPNGVIKMFNFFRTITIDPNDNIVTLAVNQDFQYLINDLIGNYTEYDLKHMVGLSSKYSKQLFKLLKQFDNNLVHSRKFCLKKTDDFKESLGIPSGYDRAHFAKLLLKITDELKPYFLNLKLEKLNKDQEIVKSGQKTKYLKWTWENEAGIMKLINKKSSKYPKEMKEIEKTNKNKETKKTIVDAEIVTETKLKNKKTIDSLEQNKLSLSMDIMSDKNFTMSEKLPWLSELSEIHDVTAYLVFVIKFEEFKKNR